MIYMALLIVYILIFGTTVVVGLYYSKSTLKLRKRIAKVDDTLNRLGSTVNNRDLIERVAIIGVIWVFTGLGSVAVYFVWVLQQKIELITLVAIFVFIYTTSVGPIILYDFLTYIYWLEFRFKQTNEFLRTLFSNPNQMTLTETRKITVRPVDQIPNGDYEAQTAKKLYLLQRMRFLRLDLCCIARTVNKIFDTQLMMLSSAALLYLTTFLYYVYVEIRKSHDSLHTNLEMIVISLVTAVTNSMQLVVASYSCEHVIQEANKITEIIHVLSGHELDDEMNNEILQLSLQITLRQTGTKFFRLNYTFLRGCMNFVMTYLVIVIQWGNSFELITSFLLGNETASF
ncbi:uncharacterized protein LOC128886465 [Hylaeus anthracinus]|uniref:uncharacterized protein LOC128886465 n=1 Tax=Hylaeus anthracinus TaxID=313031 RepID=UPI0023B9B8A2|nr:uncharacterized protein LOC128886465 [Hylaeus anthracinus]